MKLHVSIEIEISILTCNFISSSIEIESFDTVGWTAGRASGL